VESSPLDVLLGLGPHHQADEEVREPRASSDADDTLPAMDGVHGIAPVNHRERVQGKHRAILLEDTPAIQLHSRGIHRGLSRQHDIGSEVNHSREQINQVDRIGSHTSSIHAFHVPRWRDDKWSLRSLLKQRRLTEHRVLSIGESMIRNEDKSGVVRIGRESINLGDDVSDVPVDVVNRSKVEVSHRVEGSSVARKQELRHWMGPTAVHTTKENLPVADAVL